MYLTSNAAYEEPGLPINLSNKEQWSREGERYATLQLSLLTWLESENNLSRPRETDILKFDPRQRRQKDVVDNFFTPRDSLELP